MTKHYTSRSPVPSEVSALASPDMVRMAAVDTQAMGDTLMKLGHQIHQTNLARELAEGSARYNNSVDEYIQSLENKDPKDYDFVKNFGYDEKARARSTAANKTLGATMSREARELLGNKLTVWDQANSASIARAAIAKNKKITLDSLGESALNMAMHNDRDEYEELLQNIPWLTERDRKTYLMKFDRIRAQFQEKAVAAAQQAKEDEWFNHLTINNDFTLEEALQAAALIPNSEINNWGEFTSRIKNYFVLKDIQEKDAKADYERDFLDRLYSLPTEELSGLQREVLARDELDPGDQSRLHDMVTKRIKAIRDGDEAVTDSMYAGQLSDRAVILDPNDKIAMRDFEIEVRGSDKLKDEDKASLLTTAHAEFTKHQQTQLNLSHRDANNLVRSLPNKDVAILQWLESRRTRGLTMKGKEYEQDYLKWATTRTREEEIQDMEKTLSVDCTAAMNAFAATEKGRAMTPVELRKQLNSILADHIDLRDQKIALAEGGMDIAEIDEMMVELKDAQRPVRKGPVRNPSFINEYEYDVNGKEVGIKLQGGQVLKIGDEYVKNGWLMKYVGNGESDKIKPVTVYKR